MWKISSDNWGYYGPTEDFLALVVNRDITLHGVCLFGSAYNSYTVTLEANDTTKNTTVVSKSGAYLSKRLPYKSDWSVKYYGYVVLFDFTASLKMNTVYQIEALISGPPSGAGSVGIETVAESGVTFRFAAVVRSDSNGTQVTIGQFPQFLFSC